MMMRTWIMGMVCVLGLVASVLAQDVSVQGVAVPENGGEGKVTGSAVVKPGKSVTLTASPGKGSVFTAWQDGDKTAKRIVPYAEAVAHTNEAGVAVYTATFIPLSDLTVPVVTAVGGVVTGMVGVAFSLPVGYDSLSAVTLTATKLPGGLSLKNGVIAGVPKKAEKATVTLTATNPKGKSEPVLVQFEILPLPLSAQGTFTGYFTKDDIRTTGLGDVTTNQIVVGTFTVTASANGKLSAKTVTEKGKVSFSAKSWADRDGLILAAELKPSKGGEAMALLLNTALGFSNFQMLAGVTGGVFADTDWDGGAQKNAFSAKGSDATTALINTCLGYYTFGLFNQEMTALGNAENAPQGHGYGTAALKVNGSVKLAGKLADGKAFSGSVTLVLIEWNLFADQVLIPFYFSMYSGKGSVSGVLQAFPIIQYVPTLVVYQALYLETFDTSPVRWIYPGKAPAAKPAQSEDAFVADLMCLGSYYSSLMRFDTFYTQDEVFTADAPDLPYTYTKGSYAQTVEAWTNLLPDVQINTSKMALPSGKAPVFDRALNAYVVGDAVNPAQATFSLTKSSGVFKGKFNVYYDYLDENGAAKLKAVSAKHEGVVLPWLATTPGYPSGAGFYTLPDTYVDRTDPKKPVTYKLNRSFGVTIETPEP